MSISTIIERLQTKPRTRFVAFGSSNTERRLHDLHWFDWLELGLAQTYGRVHTFINTGVGGDTTPGLLARFDEDVAAYQPHVVLITIGGNDSKPDSGIDEEAFGDNLRRLDRQVRDLGAVPVFQTYYSADIQGLGAPHGTRFLAFMATVRRVAAEDRAPLVDHLRRWERLRTQHVGLYRELMQDPLHVNPLGNMVMGLDLIRTFGAQLAEEQQTYCTRGLLFQRILDALA
ncbi:MAG: GDSL-type esterase/lipase family protein [Anaerolineae bacterium]|nr:GDSL-type esterase/lipase family protein [Anaerolineae bacterium]